MGNPTIYWDKHSIDLGDRVEEASMSRLYPARTQVSGLTGIDQVNLFDSYHAGRIKFLAFNEYDLWHTFKAFWAWAMQGKPFEFTMDSAKRGRTFLDADAQDIELVANKDFEIWTPETDNLDDWTETEVGTTYIKRETAFDHVWEGLSCIRIDNDQTNRSKIVQTTSISVPASAPCSISLWYKSNSDTAGSLGIQIKNNGSSNYLRQDGSWGASQELYWHTQFKDDAEATCGVGKALWRRGHFDFTNDTTAGTFEIQIQSHTSASKDWIDAFSIRCQNKIIPLQSTHGFAADDYCLVKSRSGHFEIVKIASLSAGVSITADAALKHDYLSGDMFQHRDYYILQADKNQKTDPMLEDAGLLFPFEMRVKDYLTGRV